MQCQAQVPARVEPERVWRTVDIESYQVGRITVLTISRGPITLATLHLDERDLLALFRQLVPR